MAAKKAQTHAKRARELELKERRERKRAKKAEAAAQRAAGGNAPLGDDDATSGADAQDESGGPSAGELPASPDGEAGTPEQSEWIR